MTLEPWQREILDAGELYRVGGVVRDRLMASVVPTQDVDYLVRGVSPEGLEEILARHGKASLVGKSFGVYKFTPASGSTADIVFPRREQSTGFGHRDFDVKWDWKMKVEEDLGRRDFTINAMAEDLRTGQLIDPLGGRTDLENGIVRMVFSGTFADDPLRILRGIRFAARFKFQIEDETWSQLSEETGLLAGLSSERVQEELTRVLEQCDQPGTAFELMHQSGALAVVLPELDRCAGVTQNEFHPDDVLVHSLKTCNAAPVSSLLVRWAALLHDVGKVDARKTVTDEKGERVVFYGHEQISARMTKRVLGRLRYSSAFVTDCTRLVAEHMFNYTPEWRDATVRRFIRRVGPDIIEKLFALREADCRSRSLGDELENLSALRTRVETEVARGRIFHVGDLAVDGDDIMNACGIGPGVEIGRILNALLEIVLDSPERNTKAELLALAREAAQDGKG